ncbi:MAG: DUF4381 domain-containing protein [Desulfuromonas sp.]|uniref:DUF4381 domain-containing protein n=1 Tax=Desulfuromonas sp. TaxID=892 RepID=UPI000CB79883|nr:DUF4381 domain-containing protein [Desulfuromonas sp.]PLX81673.1 MAG: DUF4381 domain-containing protein [Desulfuromonas sp.]
MNPGQLPLRDIHLPEPISWWPPAPGWWLLAGLFALAALALRMWLVRRRQLAWRRTALAELERLGRAYAEHGDGRRLATEVSVLLRRACLCRAPRAEAAALTGVAWLDYLDAALGDGRFRQGPGAALASAPYRPIAKIDAEGLLQLCRDWLRSRPSRRGRRA